MTEYIIKKSERARTLRITIKADATVVVTIPSRMSMNRANAFIKEKERWIQQKVEFMKKRMEIRPPHMIPKGTAQERAEYKHEALALVKARLEYFNTLYGFKWNNVSIKNTSSRWGSCSRKGNLNFNYKIVMLTPALADYLVVHEMCHLKEFNHSRSFWDLVGKSIPDYAILRKKLRGIL